MVDIYCDESQDDTTYALAGLVQSPSAWDRFVPEWQRMLDRLGASAFHAAEIENRQTISKSRYKDWDRAKLVEAFTLAVDVLTDRKKIGVMWAIGCSNALPQYAPNINKDVVWSLLFFRFFHALLEYFGPQMGINLIFDEKPEVKNVVNAYYGRARAAV